MCHIVPSLRGWQARGEDIIEAPCMLEGANWVEPRLYLHSIPAHRLAASLIQGRYRFYSRTPL